MALIVKDRVKETTTTSGTGTVTLAGAEDGFQAFSVIGNGNTTYYAIINGDAWEVGLGTYTSSGTTLSRTTILESSNSGSALTLSGTSDVFCTYPAEKAVTLNGTVINDADVVATANIVNDAVTADKLANAINSEITANTAKVTNATHSGEVTGATALTITDNIVDEANLKVSNAPTNGYFLSAQSGDTGGLTWATAPGTPFSTDIVVNDLTVGKGANSVATNTVLGVGALDANTTGSLNVAIGKDALTDNTEGSQNVAIGRNSLLRNTTALGNTAIGTSALSSTLTGATNTAVGGDSLKATVGSDNTGVGYRAMQLATSASTTVAMG